MYSRVPHTLLRASAAAASSSAVLPVLRTAPLDRQRRASCFPLLMSFFTPLNTSHAGSYTLCALHALVTQIIYMHETCARDECLCIFLQVLNESSRYALVMMIANLSTIGRRLHLLCSICNVHTNFYRLRVLVRETRTPLRRRQTPSMRFLREMCSSATQTCTHYQLT